MRRESIRFRTDITFWLAILILLATMFSRHAGRISPLNQAVSSAGIEAPVAGRNSAP